MQDNLEIQSHVGDKLHINVQHLTFITTHQTSLTDKSQEIKLSLPARTIYLSSLKGIAKKIKQVIPVIPMYDIKE